jgi:hypothetical protein
MHIVILREKAREVSAVVADTAARGRERMM